MSYDAFISYSHAADGRLGPTLQQAMQRFAKPWYRTRALRVFRDDSSLSASPHLWRSIQAGLDDSAWFVLLASPQAAASEWVSRELAYWLEHKSTDRILVVVTEGTWDWSVSKSEMVGTAVPAVLRQAFTEEPRHVDLRWADATDDVDLHHARFRDAVAQVAAPVHGIAKDELDSEELRQHRRTRRIARGGISALTLLVVASLTFGVVAVIEQHRANRNATRAADAAAATVSGALASEARPLLADDRNVAALLLGVESYRFALEGHVSKHENIQAGTALLAALNHQPAMDGYLPDAIPPFTYSPDGALIAAWGLDQEVRVWSTHTRRILTPKNDALLFRFGVTAMSINREPRTCDHRRGRGRAVVEPAHQPAVAMATAPTTTFGGTELG